MMLFEFRSKEHVINARKQQIVKLNEKIARLMRERQQLQHDIQRLEGEQ